MAITEIYVDPAGDADSGDGSIGTPYLDLQHALDTVTRDNTNGDRFNIKAGTDEVLAAALTLATYGAPSMTAPLVFQGYTSAAGDGGIGGISGAGSYSVMFNTAYDYVSFIDCHCHNSGSNGILVLGFFCKVINCEVDNTTDNAIYFGDWYGMLKNCYIHNIGGYGVQSSKTITVMYNYFADGTNIFDYVISTPADGAHSNISFNVIKCSGAADGIRISGDDNYCYQNTIYSSSGTGAGIEVQAAAQQCQVYNNYIEGFSGAGGRGIDFQSGSLVAWYQSNRWYNNTTHETLSGSVINDIDNTSVASSALTNPGGGDFSVGTDLKAAGWPSDFKGSNTDQFLDIGAAQREEPAATTNIVIQGRHNVLLRR